MKHVKSERLKKLENELQDLEQWLKLGLVPKKDLPKHKEEIAAAKQKIEEEKERLQFLKESGEPEEYIAPKKAPPKAGYNEMPTIPDIDMGDTGGSGDTSFDVEAPSSADTEAAEEREDEEDEEEDEKDEEDESYFNEKNRWRRGGIIDPEADEW